MLIEVKPLKEKKNIIAGNYVASVCLSESCYGTNSIKDEHFLALVELSVKLKKELMFVLENLDLTICLKHKIVCVDYVSIYSSYQNQGYGYCLFNSLFMFCIKHEYDVVLKPDNGFGSTYKKLNYFYKTKLGFRNITHKDSIPFEFSKNTLIWKHTNHLKHIHS